MKPVAEYAPVLPPTLLALASPNQIGSEPEQPPLIDYYFPLCQPTNLVQGLHKLQLITEARKVCPDVVIVLGEDLTRFRNVSKQLYAFLRSFSWNSRCERLGFDEVFLDVTDLIEYNVGRLDTTALCSSFFHLSKNDPTVGFAFNAERLCGNSYPDLSKNNMDSTTRSDPLHTRLLLASHLAQHIRQRLDHETGYTATVGISTNKLLSKLVGNLNKPNGQTTLLPPYMPTTQDCQQDNVTRFLDDHEVGKLPGVGFKIAQKLRTHVLQRPAAFDDGLVYGGTKEHVRVLDVREFPGMNASSLERILRGPGSTHGIGSRVWDLLNGCDDTAVGWARDVPTQISVEDSYIRLDTIEQAMKELRMLTRSLLRRMHTDLLEYDHGSSSAPVWEGDANHVLTSKRWLAYPRTVRLSTRPRPPQNPDGSRNRSFARISKSAPMPSFVFNLKTDAEEVIERLVSEILLPLFRKLHPGKCGWNLSLVNVGVTNMTDAASEKGGMGRDISKMFRHQDDSLMKRMVEEPERTGTPSLAHNPAASYPESKQGSEDIPTASQDVNTGFAENLLTYEDEDVFGGETYGCEQCGALMPVFAMGAHIRWHEQQRVFL